MIRKIQVVWGIAWGVFVQGSFAFLFAFNASAATYVGEMNRFWRQQPVVDRWLVAGNGLCVVPDYFYEHDFSYQARPYSEEVLFADRLIVVRLLGGWNKSWTGGEADWYVDNEDADLFYRTATNTLGVRMEKIAPRLDSYIAYGYDDLTIVLDNTPWSMPASAVSGSYGNTAPPQYYQWFYWGVRKTIQEIATEYGPQTTSKLRFRLGTENQSLDRFSGTQTDYHKLYDWAAKAVYDELPAADFFPFNLAGGPSVSTITNYHNVNYFMLADHCEGGINYATGSVGAPFDNVPMSLYFTPVRIDGAVRRADPDLYASQRVAVWDKIQTDYPTLNFKRSIHEFGVIGSEDGLFTDEPGARGCAQRFQALVTLMEGGLDESSHWTVVDSVPQAGAVPEYLLMKGEAWLYSIFDSLSGSAAYTVPVRASSALGTQFKALVVSTSSNTVVFVSAFNIERSVHDVVSCQIDIPDNLIQFGGTMNARSVVYDRETAIHDLLRNEFDSEGILSSGYANSPDTCAEVYPMAGNNGRSYVRDNWTWIRESMVSSLTLSPFNGTVADLGSSHRLTVTLETPSVIAIVLD